MVIQKLRSKRKDNSMEKKKFEDKILELDTIINELENGEIDLNESINKYTKAMKLIKECDEELKNVEEKVNKIVLENNETKEFEVKE